MQKKKFKISKESVMIVIALSVIALFAALVLSTVNMFTYVSEAEAIERALNKSSIQVKESFGKEKFLEIKPYAASEVLYIGKTVDNARVFITKALKTQTSCYNADGISLIVVIKNDKIVSVDSYKHAETPGLGSKALDASYLTQYKGKNINSFKVSSDPSIASPEVEGEFKYTVVTSATYSSVGVNVAVKSAIKAYIDTKNNNMWR